MDPYRSQAVVPHPRVSFGERGRSLRWMILGLALVAVTVGAVLAASLLGGGMQSAAFLFGAPGAVGVLLLSRATWGWVELWPERRVLVVERWGYGRRRRATVPLADVRSLEVVPANLSVSLSRRAPDFDLNLVLGAGDRRIRLLRAGGVELLEADRASITAFLREHGVIGGAVGDANGRARVGETPPPRPPASQARRGEREERLSSASEADDDGQDAAPSSKTSSAS